MSSEGNESSLKASLEEVWYLKDISFRPEPNAPPKRLKIITQNFNGSVSSVVTLVGPKEFAEHVTDHVLSLQYVRYARVW